MYEGVRFLCLLVLYINFKKESGKYCIVEILIKSDEEKYVREIYICIKYGLRKKKYVILYLNFKVVIIIFFFIIIKG